MKTIAGSALVLCATGVSAPALAQTPVGALAVDERQGDQYGWAVDYETAGEAQSAAVGECGAGCSVVLTFERCAAYAADQDADSTAVGWAESYSSAGAAQQAALGECSSRGSGLGCIVRVWGCNSPVVEEGLGLDRVSRREIQEGLRAAGFDPGGADGMFGPRTRAAIRRWQSSRGARATGYLDGASVASLRPSVVGQPTFRQREPGGAAAASARTSSLPPAAAAQQQSSPVASAEQESLFWQSIVNSTDPVDFEAYLEVFPNGVFRRLAENRLAALGTSGGAAPAGSVFRPDRTCAGQPAGAACWMELSGRPGCYAWNPFLAQTETGVTATWTGECRGGLTRGAGSLTWVWDGNEQLNTGRFEDGKQHGHWVIRYADGGISEGPYVAGERHGRWVEHHSDGTVAEGLFVAGARHGEWTIRRANGDTPVFRYENGELVEVR